MVRFESIRNIINTFIRPNGKGEITGETMNNVLQGMLDDIDFAIEESGAGSEEGGTTGGGSSTLEGLRDVRLGEQLEDGEVLTYDEDLKRWVNKALDGIATGLTEDIPVEVAVGYLKKGDVLRRDTSITDILQQMLTADIKAIPPQVKIRNYPSSVEVGEEVALSPIVDFTDGQFTNTEGGTINAGCAPGDPAFYLDGKDMPTSYITESEKVHTISVSVPYSASTAEVKNKAGEVKDISISAGTATANVQFYACYRYFWGYITKAQNEEKTSEIIRGLKSELINPFSPSVVLLNAEEKAEEGKIIVVAVPEEYSLKSVEIAPSGDMAKQFKVDEMEISCAGDAVKNYKVYHFTPATGSRSMTLLKISIIRG